MGRDFTARLRELSREATAGPWRAEASEHPGSHAAHIKVAEGTYPVIRDCILPLDFDADLIVYLRNNADAIAGLVEAAASTGRLRGFVVGHSWPLEMMPEVMAAERELDRIATALEVLNVS